MILLLSGGGSGSAYTVEALPHPFFYTSDQLMSRFACPHPRAHPRFQTALVVLAFTVPYRQMPIYQRDETVDETE